ncbi:MAG: trehalose 6-phosphate phosphatase [Actinomycetota bacterium]|nr:MAG: trehalose 6-phosphate phosphatase [Actinomycetota bacterium]
MNALLPHGLDRLRPLLARAAVLLDFDGTLAPIVPRPEDARPIPGAAEVLAGLAARARAVAIVTGRPAAQVRALLPVAGLRVVGLYGFEGHPPLPPEVLAAVEAVAAAEPGARVEPKGPSVAVHVRTADDPDGAQRRLRRALEPVAAAHGLVVRAGKRVWELVPAGVGSKAGAVAALIDELRPAAVLYAGDDVADLEAFGALGRAERSGLVAVRVAVHGPETPAALEEAADAVVNGPEGLLDLLRGL